MLSQKHVFLFLLKLFSLLLVIELKCHSMVLISTIRHTYSRIPVVVQKLDITVTFVLSSTEG